MPHERPMHDEAALASKKVSPSKAQVVFSTMQRDIRALNSSILIMSQKMKYLVRNEKILGRNLLVLNKKIRDSEAGGGGSMASSQSLEETRREIANLSSAVDKASAMVSELQTSIEEIKETYAKAEQLKEVKYVIDSINPLEFVTYKEVDKLIDEKLKGKKQKK